VRAEKPGQANHTKKQGLIFVVSGPSGSGKTTLLKKLLKDGRLKKGLIKSVSFTTRPKRSGEKDRRDYFFITKERFRQKLKAKKILEWTRYLGYYYATPRDFVEKELKKSRQVLLCLDLKGALRIKEFYPKNTVLIFIIPPSLETLRERIRARCNKTKKEEIRERLKLAKRELLVSSSYDYCLVNKNLQQAAEKLRKIILKETHNYNLK
jgi:guanylate kinase